jgi:hypothetical protein
MRLTLIALMLLANPAWMAAESAAVDEAAAVADPVGPWKRSLVSGLNVNQAHFDNWRAGGEDSLAWSTLLNGSLRYQTPQRNWSNSLKLAYGQSRIGAAEPIKSADSIHVDSSYTRILNQYVNPFVSVAWDTQFVTGYQYFSGTTLTPVAVSKFMDPGYLSESLGLGYAKGEAFKFKLGAAAKQTFTDAYPGYADDPKTAEVERFKNEWGASAQAELKLSLGQDLLFESKLDLFSNLVASDQIDVKWANLLSAKVNSWLSTNLFVDLVYDKDVSTQRQLKQGLSLTFSYNLL